MVVASVLKIFNMGFGQLPSQWIFTFLFCEMIQKLNYVYIYKFCDKSAIFRYRLCLHISGHSAVRGLLVKWDSCNFYKCPVAHLFVEIILLLPLMNMFYLAHSNTNLLAVNFTKLNCLWPK